MKSSSGEPLHLTTSGVKTSTRSLAVRVAPSFFAMLPFCVLKSLYCAVLLRASSSNLLTTDIKSVRLSEIGRDLGYLASSHDQFVKYSMKERSWRWCLILNSARASNSKYWRSSRCTMLSTWESFFASSSVKRMRLSKEPKTRDFSPSGTAKVQAPASLLPLTAGLLLRVVSSLSFSASSAPVATTQNSWPKLMQLYQ